MNEYNRTTECTRKMESLDMVQFFGSIVCKYII